MNTPPTGVPDPPHVGDLVAGVMNNNLSERLEEVEKSRKEATPEIQYPEDAEECYQWKCEELRNHFKPHEAEKHRMHISQRDYWELECLHYNDMLKDIMWKKARAVHGEDGEPTADHWRAVAMLYQGLLRRHNGLSLAQVNETRQAIRNQKYWQCEADLYQERVTLREHEMRAALRQKDEMQRRRQTRRKRRVQQPRPTNQKTPPDDSVATRTRSRTSTGGGVAKHVIVRRTVDTNTVRRR